MARSKADTREHDRWHSVRFLVCLIPVIGAFAVWLSSLAFVPVPWPDDSAFYFVAHEFFRWPPRWVMLPQAPFEPSYATFNFNTMPLYPILIGLGRFIGIDGSFALKFWPLGAWAASGSLLAYVLLSPADGRERRAPVWLVALVSLALATAPILRWASVLVRPESLIGLFAMALVLGLTFGFPRKVQPRGLWDPVSALLAISAYSHFNAIHLLFPVILTRWRDPRGLLRTGLICALYLSPWFIAIAAHPTLFVQQLTVQFQRLAIGNDWLSTPAKAIESLFPSMGSPEPWPSNIMWNGFGLWTMIAASIFVTVFSIGKGWEPKKSDEGDFSLAPAAGWVLGSVWLWHTKPELWFLFYLHLSAVVFCGLMILRLIRQNGPTERALGIATAALLALMTANSLWVDGAQAKSLGSSATWHWPQYHGLVDCVDARLKQALEAKGTGSTFRVWGPTFPDILVELSRRHPEWNFTRTNDFWNRNYLAEKHAREVDAVVVTDTLSWEERDISAPMSEHPNIHSTWMEWDQYYLKNIGKDPNWKPVRYLCQRGRWQAFIYLNR